MLLCPPGNLSLMVFIGLSPFILSLNLFHSVSPAYSSIFLFLSPSYMVFLAIPLSIFSFQLQCVNKLIGIWFLKYHASFLLFLSCLILYGFVYYVFFIISSVFVFLQTMSLKHTTTMSAIIPCCFMWNS